MVALLQLLGQRAHRAEAKVLVAARHHPHGVDQFPIGSVLHQIPAGTRLQQPDQVFVLGVHGEDQDACRRRQALQLARRGRAVHDVHAQVHHHHIGLQAHGGIHRLTTVRGLADDRDVGRGLQDSLQPVPHDRMVVGEEHGDYVVVHGDLQV